MGTDDAAIAHVAVLLVRAPQRRSARTPRSPSKRR